MKNINIPNPCSENWEMMSPREKGKFCSVCNKCVIDFTQKYPDEIQRIIEEKKDEEVCGRFYNHQLNKVDQSEKLKAQFFKYIPTYFQNNKITLTVFSLILFLTGCSKQQNESCTTTTGMMVSNVETDTVKNKDYIMGEAKIVENDSVAKIYKKDSVTRKSKSSKK
ncbi:hypothetical protein GCM10023210_31520 [Chryseobacterium ginsengisoli]|uniref:Lipoprotein n=1 Tax=Chryseobacterium ginsengisoli TaxID=363853 RepID=A0ABP9MN09_9FLAO